MVKEQIIEKIGNSIKTTHDFMNNLWNLLDEYFSMSFEERRKFIKEYLCGVDPESAANPSFIFDNYQPLPFMEMMKDYKNEKETRKLHRGDVVDIYFTDTDDETVKPVRAVYLWTDKNNRHALLPKVEIGIELYPSEVVLLRKTGKHVDLDSILEEEDE